MSIYIISSAFFLYDVSEEKAFLKNYTVPFVQLEPKKVILVFSHIHNTFDKKKLLDNPHPNFVKTSDKTVDEFVKEPDIKDFFLNKIEGLLENYEPGHPKMKPDVLKQISEIEQSRKKMAAENNGSIMLQQDGKDPVQLTQQQVLQHLNDQNKKMQELVEVLKQRDKTILELQNRPSVATSNDSIILKELETIKLLLNNRTTTEVYYKDYNFIIN